MCPGVIVSEPKTAKGRRQIALDAVTVESFKAQAGLQLSGPGQRRGRLDRDRLRVHDGRRPGDAPAERVTGVRPGHRCGQATEETRLHDLRHTHASLALAAGVNPKVISERLGHATVSITLDTYSHAIPALQEEAARDRGAGALSRLSDYCQQVVRVCQGWLRS